MALCWAAVLAGCSSSIGEHLSAARTAAAATSSPDPSTTNDTASTTSPTAPPTTATPTVPPTTRATVPTTRPTTTSVPATTVTTAPATTTTTPASSSTSNDAWIWAIVGVAIAALIGLMIYLLVARRNRRRATLAWRPTARGALDNAVMARDLLVAEPSTTDAAAHESVRTKVSEAADMLDRVATDAPDDDARLASHDTAEALRGLLFAIEAERLLPGGRLPPTADQLAQADLNRRQRETDLESAMARLRQHVTGTQARTTP